MAVVQASSRRAWPSIAARDAGSSVSPSARSPASSAASYAGGRGGVSSTRVGSGSRGRSTTRLLWFACHPAARRRSRRRHRVALLAACRSSPIHPVRGRVSPCPSWTALPWRLPQCGCRTVEVAAGLRQPGFPRTLPASVDSWITGASSGRATRPADRPPERPPDDVDDLVDVLVGLALLGRRPDAAADVVLEEHDRHARRPRRAGRPSAAGCRRSTPRARSSGRCPEPGPPSATGDGRAGPCPSNSCGGSGSDRLAVARAARSGSSVVSVAPRRSRRAGAFRQ